MSPKYVCKYPKQAQDQRRQGTTKKPQYDIEHMAVDNSKCPEKETNSYKGLIYHNHESGMREYYTEKEIQALGYKLLKWATEEQKADKLQTFFAARLIPSITVASLRKQFPAFDADCKLAREIIGCKLWSGSLWADSGMRENAALKLLPCYDEEYREETNRVARLRIIEQIEQAQKQLIIIKQDYSSEALERQKALIEEIKRLKEGLTPEELERVNEQK